MFFLSSFQLHWLREMRGEERGGEKREGEGKGEEGDKSSGTPLREPEVTNRPSQGSPFRNPGCPTGEPPPAIRPGLPRNRFLSKKFWPEESLRKSKIVEEISAS